MIPYTYLIGWSQHNKFYYGVKFAKSANPADLFVKYFTSSGHVKLLLKEHGEPDIIQIRKTFKTREEAIEWEIKCLRRLQVHKRPELWLNRNVGGSIRTYEPRSLESRQRMSIIMKGKNKGNKVSEQLKRHLREVNLGKKYGPRSQDTIDKMKAAWVRRKVSQRQTAPTLSY